MIFHYLFEFYKLWMSLVSNCFSSPTRAFGVWILLLALSCGVQTLCKRTLQMYEKLRLFAGCITFLHANKCLSLLVLHNFKWLRYSNNINYTHKLIASYPCQLTTSSTHNLITSQPHNLTTHQTHNLTNSQPYQLTNSPTHKLISLQ